MESEILYFGESIDKTFVLDHLGPKFSHSIIQMHFSEK